jgi:hypothetical protein
MEFNKYCFDNYWYCFFSLNYKYTLDLFKNNSLFYF